MKYTDYEGYTKTYVLVHNTGFGVMESPHREHEIVYETDDWEDAVKKSNELKFTNNTQEEIEFSWYNNSYQINVNTLSEGGKVLEKEFEEKFKIISEENKKNPNYRQMTMPNGSIIGYVEHPLFDGESPPSDIDFNTPPDFKMRIRFAGPKKD